MECQSPESGAQVQLMLLHCDDLFSYTRFINVPYSAGPYAHGTLRCVKLAELLPITCRETNS
jgi:hypothetical protein